MKIFKVIMNLILFIAPYSLAEAKDLVCVSEIETNYQNNQAQYLYKSLRIQDFDLQKINRNLTIEYISHELPQVPFEIIKGNKAISLGRDVKIIAKKQVQFSQTILDYNYLSSQDVYVTIKTDRSKVGVEFIATDVRSELFGRRRIVGNQCLLLNN